MFSKKEAVLVDELLAFSGGIYGNHALYQVSQPDSVTIKNAVDDFIAKRTIWNTPATRTIGSYEAKQASKIGAVGICRSFYGLIQQNGGISNEDKLLIGVTPLNYSRTRRDCPITSPTVTIAAGTPGALTAEYRNSVDMNSRGLPLGATMCQVFVEIGTENAEIFDETKARFVGNYTTNPMAIILNPEDRGKQATLFARWGGKRNQFGNWSLPVSMTIAA